MLILVFNWFTEDGCNQIREEHFKRLIVGAVYYSLIMRTVFTRTCVFEQMITE
jgi:hypothetical protein